MQDTTGDCNISTLLLKTLTNVKVLLFGKLQLVVCNDYGALQVKAHGSRRITARIYLYNDCGFFGKWPNRLKFSPG